MLRLAGIAAGQGPQADLGGARRPDGRADGREVRPGRDGGGGAARAGAAARPDAARRTARPDPRRPRGRTARGRPGSAHLPRAGGAADRERPDRADPRARSPATCRDWWPPSGARRAARTTWSSSGDDSWARTTRGCTTSPRWSGARTPAPPTSTPTTRRGSGCATAATAVVRSRAGSVTVPVEVTDAVRPGVVSIPHGWGHSSPGTRTDGRVGARRRQQQRPGRRPVRRRAHRDGRPQRHPGHRHPSRGAVMDRMSAMDAMFYYVESENTPMHVGGVSVLEGPAPAYGDLVRLLAAQAGPGAALPPGDQDRAVPARSPAVGRRPALPDPLPRAAHRRCRSRAAPSSCATSPGGSSPSAWT